MTRIAIATLFMLFGTIAHAADASGLVGAWRLVSFEDHSADGKVAINRFDFGTMQTLAETPESASLGYVGIGILAILLGTNKKLKIKL